MRQANTQSPSLEKLPQAYQTLINEYKKALDVLAIHAPADAGAREVLERSKSFQLSFDSDGEYNARAQ